MVTLAHCHSLVILRELRNRNTRIPIRDARNVHSHTFVQRWFFCMLAVELIVLERVLKLNVGSSRYDYTRYVAR